MEGMKMTNCKQHFCRLCLNFINEKPFTVIENVISDILDFVLLKVDFDEISNCTMCSMCRKRLFAAFDFKSLCVDKDDIIMTYVDVEEELPLDIMEIFRKEMEKKKLNVKLEINQVCRLCLKLVTDEFVPVQEMNPNLIKTCIPGMDFEVTKDPVICTECFNALNVHAAFLISCTNAQNNINNIIQQDNVQELSVEPLTVYVKSETMEVKRESNEDDNQSTVNSYHSISNEKIENNGSGKGKFVKFHKCDECDYQTRQKHHLKRHYLRHKDISEIEMYKCEQCDFQTKYKRNIERHELIHNDMPEEKMYKCDKCDHRTKYRQALLFHQLTHKDASEVKMYKCEECDFQTKHRQGFANHRLKHADKSQVKMYKCPECDYQAIQKRYLRNHQLNHKSESEVKIYKCDHCDFRTKYKRHCVRHELSHKGVEVKIYKCSQCEFRSQYKQHCVRHELTHSEKSEEKNYKCDRCEYRAKYKHHLDRHALTHKDLSEVNVYSCEECGLETKHRQSMMRHKIRRHGNKSKVTIKDV